MSTDRLIVGMSGGVDSAVTAALLKQDGHEVGALTLTFWKEEGDEEKSWKDRSCCKVGLARFVARRLGIPLEVVDLQETFRREVIDDFCDVYLTGATPNPCVRCNERIKFGSLLELAQARGADALATGHYAQVRYDPESGRFRLFRSADRSKDQSYFLYRLRQSQLSRVRFPLGALRKEDVYQKATALGLPYEEVLESQEICFVHQKDYREVLAELRPDARRPGRIVDPEGRILGRHDGVAFYTVGQRRGLGIAADRRLYVTEIRSETHEVVLGEEKALYRETAQVGALNWIRWEQPPLPFRAEVKVRYRSSSAWASVIPSGSGEISLRFDLPQRGIAPGQSAVLYWGDEVVGGGIIEKTGSPDTAFPNPG